MRQVDVICPVFREEEGIGLFHARLQGVLDRLSGHYTWRILYVLDPSPDRTEVLLSSIAATDPRVEVLVLSRRFGHQAALVAGIDHCCGDAAIMMDSDLQHPPELIPELIRQWEGGAEIVQTVRQDGKETGWPKRIASRWFYASFFKLGAVELRSGAADYRLLSARVLQVIRDELREHNPFLRGLISWVGYRIVYVPFIPERRLHGRSKYRPTTLLNFALNGLCSFSKVPLRFCIGAGFVLAILSFISAFLQIVAYFLSNYAVPGWASLLSAVTLLGGIQLLFLGVLGEYVGLIVDEVKDRPRYLVDKRYSRQCAVGPATTPVELIPLSSGNNRPAVRQTAGPSS
jgi:polyisoprenyl-phosphate glycosyltransferase